MITRISWILEPIFPTQETVNHLSARPGAQRYTGYTEEDKPDYNFIPDRVTHTCTHSITHRISFHHHHLLSTFLSSFYFLFCFNHLQIIGSQEFWTSLAVRNLARKNLTVSGKESYSTIPYFSLPSYYYTVHNTLIQKALLSIYFVSVCSCCCTLMVRSWPAYCVQCFCVSLFANCSVQLYFNTETFSHNIFAQEKCGVLQSCITGPVCFSLLSHHCPSCH